MMTYFKIVNFLIVCMILKTVAGYSSILGGTVNQKNDNMRTTLLNFLNVKYSLKKSEDYIAEKNFKNLNQITAGNISKEWSSFAVSSGKSSSLQCRTSTGMCDECGGGRDDHCGSCDVDNPDYQLDACNSCISPDDPSWNNCSAITSVYPLVLDKAFDSPVQLLLELSKALEEGDSLKCFVFQNTKTIEASTAAVDETAVTLSVPLESLMPSESRLHCEGWTDPPHPLVVVNSMSLSVSSVTPNNISLRIPTQLKLMVHGISAPVDLFCFLINQNQTVLVIEPTNQIAGNPVSSTVVCRLTLTRPSSTQLFIGVSYSRGASKKMSFNNMMRITQLALSLIPLRADFTEDLRHVWVEFNHNIEGSSDCSGVFSNSSLNSLGKGIECEYRGNKIIVKLGREAKLQPRDVLRFSRNANTLSASGLTLAGSNILPVLAQDVVYLPFAQRSPPTYILVGPSKLCQHALTSVVVVTLTAQQLWYNWTMLVTDVLPLVPPQQRQRRNLLVWLGAREVVRPARHANLQSLLVNASLLMPNVNYRLEVVARNMLGLVGPPATLDMQLSTTTNATLLSLVILGPAAALVSQPLPLELCVTSSCGVVCLDHVEFQWKISREKGNNTVMLDARGLKTTIPSTVVNVPGTYNVTCVMTNNSAVLAKAGTLIEVRQGRIALTIIPAAVVMRSQQSLVLDISKSLRNINISTLQITWKCKRADKRECTTRGSEKPIFTMSSPKLKLPPDFLSEGRYQWTVVVKQMGSDYSSSAEVEVVRGTPPLLTAGPPSFMPYLFIPASAQNLRPGCRLKWTSLHLLGYDYLSLDNISGSDLEISRGTKGNLPLKVSERMLQPKARYYLRFSAFCNAAESVSADFIISIDPKPSIEGFQVHPLQGMALVTQFNFSMKRSTEFGNIYSFGYYLPSGSPTIFYSSAYSLSTMTLLPAFSATGSQIRTLARICSPKEVCSVQEGPVVQSDLPALLSSQQISFLSKLMSSATVQGEPREAMALVTAVLGTTKLMANQTAFQSLSTGVVEAILQRINQTSQRLKNASFIRPEAILLLDSVTRVLPLLCLNDSALSIIVGFRDQLASIPRPAGKPAKLINAQLLIEPRASREKRQQPIPAETVPETPDTVEIWLRTSETAILSFSPNKSLEEKRKLLTNLNSYVTGLCQWLPDFQPIYIGGQVVSLSVQKLSISDNSLKVKSINIPNCHESCGPTARVNLGKDFIGHFKKINVEYICLSGFQFPFGSLDVIFSLPSGFIQLSAVYRLKFLTYSASSSSNNKEPPKVQLVIPLMKSSPVSFSPQCCIIQSNIWMSGVCETVAVNESTATCKCPPYEYYSVFAVPIPTTTTTTSTTEMTTTTTTTTTEVPTTTTTTTQRTTEETTTVVTTTSPQTSTSMSTSPSTPSTPTPVPVKVTTQPPEKRKVAFRIEEKFDKVVGQNSTEFSENIKKQLMKQLSIPEGAICDVYVTEGRLDVTLASSVVVTLAMRDTEQSPVEESVMELAQALEVGQLNLRTADNKPLPVPKQPLTVLRSQPVKQGGLSAVFLAASSLGLCGLVVVYVTLVSLFSSHSRRREALRATQRKAADKVPRYSTLPLPHTLDGSSFRQGTWSGDDLDSGIYDSDGGRRNAIGKIPKQKVLQTTNF